LYKIRVQGSFTATPQRLVWVDLFPIAHFSHETASPAPYCFSVLSRSSNAGIDLMLAGHTHGGQLSLDFVHRGLNLSHLIYDYNHGWYEKNGAQLYVNRGIGTTGFPIRLGARPEISMLELSST
jgi:hypothetical protein